MFRGKRREKRSTASRVEVSAAIWLPEANRFGNLLASNNIRYAIFGAGALAVHNVMVRPTVDIDFVVDDYKRVIALLQDRQGIVDKNLGKEKDGIQVADFYLESGVTVQIWDNNLYSLPMTDNSWSRVTSRAIPGYDLIQAISMEDLIISKVGRYTQQRKESEYEADKNVKDVVTTIITLPRPDFKYAIQRLKEGARRETSSGSSKIHPLDWYFVREIEVYRRTAESLRYREQVGTFIATILTGGKTPSIEYWLLHSLRKGGSIRKFKVNFMLDERSLSLLLKRWQSILQITGDKVTISSGDIQNYIGTLGAEMLSEYAKRIVYSGKSKRE